MKIIKIALVSVLFMGGWLTMAAFAEASSIPGMLLGLSAVGISALLANLWDAEVGE